MSGKPDGRLGWCLIRVGELLPLPCELGNPETAFEAGGSGHAQGSRAILSCLPSCWGSSCKEVIFALGFRVKLPRPAESIVSWEFVHLTAQMGHFS